ncbi:SPASM domain-containing protein [Clostridium sp. SYSU_GA19001]|uniref:radical SAM/SPASM domain-containing protein n=1 Tax=Clostridium caldaquaticum TaxID=2940653 RepID=UPI0020774FDC|nr:radical SAM/SPASM domain-containing protein [Clostridium caldaquaticum]MCM8709698.1 SPASM domain-containing protein [Clostridium caldaquaticum]
MKKFKKIYIEITNICNLKCEFCPVTKRSPKFMDINTFNLILSQITHFTDYIYLHVKGEPLLHPNLDKFLDLADNYGFKVNITTNGTLIEEVKDKLLNKKALRQINFSLHSFDANDLNFSIEQYLNNIINFTFDAIKKNNIIVSYRLWNLEEDTKSIEKNRHILNLLENSFKLDYKIEDVLLDNRGIKITKNIYLNVASIFEWPDKNLKQSDTNGFCYGLRNQAAILVDGTVVPCCLDGEGVINLGNINENNFSEIIESPRAKAIYEGFSNRHIIEELCKKCTYRKRFN